MYVIPLKFQSWRSFPKADAREEKSVEQVQIFPRARWTAA